MARQAVGGKDVEWEDVQGLVLRGHGRLLHGCYSLVSIDDPNKARAYLARLADAVTNGIQTRPERALQVALSAGALQKLGVAPESLRTFSVPFVEGMVTPHRSRVLGDQGSDAPENWQWGYASETAPDVLLMLFASSPEKVEEFCEEILSADSGCSVQRRFEVYSREDGHEHLGFLDGISQPLIKGAITSKGPQDGDTEPGEMVLGYLNSLGLLTPVPEIGVEQPDEGAFGQNGSYLVLRQMDEDVKAFYDCLPNHGIAPDLMAAKLLGRWPNGSPLSLYPTAPNPDYSEWLKENPDKESLTFSDDPYGRKCPIGAHMRRSNPRDGLTNPEATPADAKAESIEIVSHHRIMRRGRLYGPVWQPRQGEAYTEAARGLHFLCLNASIENQFEFLQQTWINSTKFSGLYDEVDPMVGVNQSCPGSTPYSIPESPVRQQIASIPRFITVRGGGYFFLPGIKALKMLSRLAGPKP